MTQNTPPVYFTMKESDGVLHQMTWPPQSPNLNPFEMVWDELDSRVKEKQLTRAHPMWELLQDWKGDAGWENSNCKAVIKAKGGYFEESKMCIFTCLTLFGLLQVFSFSFNHGKSVKNKSLFTMTSYQETVLFKGRTTEFYLVSSGIRSCNLPVTSPTL